MVQDYIYLGSHPIVHTLDYTDYEVYSDNQMVLNIYY